MSEDLLQYKVEADAALDRLALTLKRLLQEATARLDPFPAFPGAFFTYGIEIDAQEVSSPDRGCVVLAPDGELYEMVMGQDVTALALDQSDPVALREEQLQKLDDLHPREYVAYAYSALTAVVELLLQRRSGTGDDPPAD